MGVAMATKTTTSHTVTLVLTIPENAYLYSFLLKEKARLVEDLAFFKEEGDWVLVNQLTEDLNAVNDLIHMVGSN